MSSTDGIAALFDAVADEYDALGVDFFGPIAEALVASLAPQPGERMLDVGCGRGAALLRLAEAVGADGQVQGLDASPRMVELAQQAAAAQGLDVDVQVGDAMAPPFEPASFEVVASSLVLFFLPDPAAALMAWRELLVDGGRVGVTTFGPYTPAWREQVDLVLVRHAEGEEDEDTSKDARSSGAQGPFASDEGMEQLLAAAGFRDVHTTTTTVSPRFDDPDHWHRWSMSVGQRRYWQQLTPEQHDVVKEELQAVVDGIRAADGRIGFDQTVRCTLGVR